MAKLKANDIEIDPEDRGYLTDAQLGEMAQEIAEDVMAMHMDNNFHAAVRMLGGGRHGGIKRPPRDPKRKGITSLYQPGKAKSRRYKPVHVALTPSTKKPTSSGR